AENSLILRQLVELTGHLFQVAVQRRKLLTGRRADGLFESRERTLTGRVRLFEPLDQLRAWPRGKIARANAHLDQRRLEFAADVGEVGRALAGLVRLFDLVFADRESDAVDQEAGDRDHGERNDANANRGAGHDAVDRQSHGASTRSAGRRGGSSAVINERAENG